MLDAEDLGADAGSFEMSATATFDTGPVISFVAAAGSPELQGVRLDSCLAWRGFGRTAYVRAPTPLRSTDCRWPWATERDRTMMTDPFEHRRSMALRGLAPDGRGIELGPLDNPIARRPDYDVLYVDHADTATIRAKYAAHATVGEIVDVDVAWDGRLRDLVAPDVPIRWAIASHVIEHVPDLVSWLDEIAEVVEVGGILSLVVPDHRYCFDANRAPSRPSDVLGAVLEGRSRPSAAQLVDYLCLTTGVDTAAIWRGESDHAERPANWQGGYDLAVAAWQSTDYVDCHCWTFTPVTFLEALDVLFAVGMLRTWTVESHRRHATGVPRVLREAATRRTRSNARTATVRPLWPRPGRRCRTGAGRGAGAAAGGEPGAVAVTARVEADRREAPRRRGGPAAFRRSRCCCAAATSERTGSVRGLDPADPLTADPQAIGPRRAHVVVVLDEQLDGRVRQERVALHQASPQLLEAVPLRHRHDGDA